MKRSKNIDLNLMRKGSRKRAFCGSLAIGLAATALASCSSQEEVQVASSPEECASTTELTLVECEAAYQRAQAEAERTGPKYTSSSQCETEFGRGQCMQSNTGGFFMPMMTGFMIGRMMSGGSSYGGAAYNPVYRYSNPYSSQNNRIMTADGTVIGKAGQRSYRVNKSTMKPKPSVTRTVSRGGFGAMASAKSSWGRGKSGGWGG
ncbi:MAG: DUF1190 domain-containing protein [Desulfobulbaceae bacterium]|nr:DUF1190 domain-containing protein [Desulfobulbaceae bacterium]